MVSISTLRRREYIEHEYIQCLKLISFHYESILDGGDENSHLVPEIRFFESLLHNPPNNDCSYIFASLFVFRSINFDTGTISL